MNIKRAKQEIKNTIQVYLTKNEHGEYEIPSMRQRPVLLIGPPGIGKTQIMSRWRGSAVSVSSPTRSHTIRDRVPSVSRLSRRRLTVGRMSM